MKFEKDFNPGQNNTYQEYNFGPGSQNFPNVTELTINNYGTQEDKVKPAPAKVAPKTPADSFSEPDPNKDLTAAKTAILNYVSRIAAMLKPERMHGWERFWTGLLDLDVIEKDICDITKQQGTTFNRKLICKIIHHLDHHGFYSAPYKASAMAEALENNKDHSIRTHGLNQYPDDAVCRRIDSYIETFEL